MASTKATEDAVSLPAGPIDADALHAALKAGKSGDDAIKAATKNNPVPEEVEPDETAPIVVADPEPAAPAAASAKE